MYIYETNIYHILLYFNIHLAPSYTMEISFIKRGKIRFFDDVVRKCEVGVGYAYFS